MDTVAATCEGAVRRAPAQGSRPRLRPRVRRLGDSPVPAPTKGRVASSARVGPIFAILIVSVAAATAPQPGSAFPGAPPWAGAPLERSGTILRGKLTEWAGDEQATEAVARVSVDAVLKGDPRLVGRVVEFRMTMTGPSFTGTTRVGDYALFCVGSVRDGRAEPVDNAYPRMLIKEGRPVLPQEPVDVTGRIQAELFYTLRDGDPAIRPEAARQLGHLPATKEGLELLRGLLKSSDPELRVAALEALLWLRQPDAVKPAVEILKASRLPTGRVSGSAALRDAVLAGSYLLPPLQQLSSPDVIDPIAELLTAPTASLREMAATILAQTDDGKAVPPLIRALDDADANVRARAVCGLARLLRRPLWGQAPDLVKQDEATYINRWKEWWAKEGKALFEPEEPKAK